MLWDCCVARNIERISYINLTVRWARNCCFMLEFLQLSRIVTFGMDMVNFWWVEREVYVAVSIRRWHGQSFGQVKYWQGKLNRTRTRLVWLSVDRYYLRHFCFLSINVLCYSNVSISDVSTLYTVLGFLSCYFCNFQRYLYRQFWNCVKIREWYWLISKLFL